MPSEQVTPGASSEPLAAGTQIGDYRVRGLLGEGAMGEVYLAQDTVLGRRVALKLIKRAVMDADGVARFLEEARTTANFNHPHIVTLHAVGEHAGRPFLALEHVDGESLRARLRGGPLPAREALRYARAIAEAIAEAHRRGLVHADLKPENVLIPRDGRVRVVDFGLAKLIGDGATGGTSGTPAYMAPERLRGAAPTGALDVWALGLLLGEMITGARPIADGAVVQHVYGKAPLVLAMLPETGWSALVRGCLAAEPAARPTAEELVRRLGVLLDPRARPAADTAEAAERSPFPGLVAFARGDAADYFGRAAELDALVEALRTRPLVPIVGPSGIGKSSFVNAALLPRLDEAGSWRVAALRPGASPFAALAHALTGAAAPGLAAALRANPDALALELGTLAAQHGARVLLFIDQFEETFTLAASDEAAAFVECVASAATLPGEPWRTVLTVRDDFLARLAESPRLRIHLGAVAPLAPLGAAELLAAVTGPLANAGYTVDAPELPARIVADVSGQAACLPLLQFACRALWDRRDAGTRRVLASEYDAMGGATGALAAHAQALLSELAPDQVRSVRAILLGLFHPDGTRRPRRRRELVNGMPADASAVVDQLLARRLVVATRDVESDETQLEVAHEALATAWPQLARWLDETSEQRLLVIELEQATQLWQRRGQRDDETWSGAALGEAVRKIDEWNVSVPTSTRGFLDASLRRAARARRRRRAMLGLTIGALAAVAVGAIGVAVSFAKKEAEARLAAEDMGEFDLELAPFDWDPATQTASAPAAHPALTWKLFYEDPQHPHETGKEYGEGELVRHGATWRGAVSVERVEARSSAAVIVVTRGAECSPSTIRLQRLPGYRERLATRTVLHLRVPTCAASKVDMVEIPAGPFYRNVYGTEELATTGAFAIGRTEVTRGAFDEYTSMKVLTGDESLLPRADGTTHAQPIAGVNFEVARAYCRFAGADLPVVDEWQKSFRGGVFVSGLPNNAPTRSTPWATTTSPRPANLGYDEETGPSAVGTFREDRSPYGVFDLAGNVSEWSKAIYQAPAVGQLRLVLGSAWSVDPKLEQQNIKWRNTHPDQYLEYGLGIRCVSQY